MSASCWFCINSANFGRSEKIRPISADEPNIALTIRRYGVVPLPASHQARLFMIRLILRFAVLNVLCCCGLASAQSPRLKTATVANLLPETTVAYAEISSVSQIVSTIFDHPLRAKIEALPPYQQAIGSPQYQKAMTGVAMFENLLGMSWREAIEAFTADGIAIAIDSSTRGVAIIADGKDPETMKMFRDRVIGLVAMDKKRDLQSVEYRGIKAHRIDDLRVAVYDDQMLLTNNSDLGKSILDRMLDGGDETFATNARFLAAQQTRDPNASGWGFLDIETIRDSGVADKFYHGQINNPVLELIVGGIQSNLEKTPYATGNLSVATQGLAFKLAVPHDKNWIPEQREYFFGADGNGRGPALPSVDQTLFTFSTYRDFAQMWLRAGDLFDADTNDGFAKADAALTTFFAGKDFGEDILGSIDPPVGFVATKQNFTEMMPRPAIKLPAFGLVMQLKDPEKMTREMKRTFQSLVGFFNVVSAMQGFNQSELDMEKNDDGTLFVSATFIPEEDDQDSTEAPILFNFSPTIGFSGERFVVASSTALCKQLTLAPTPDPKYIADNVQGVLQARVLKGVLSDNREQLIAQNMLEDGNSREEAEAQIDLLLQFVEYFHDASIRLGQSGEQLQAEFAIRIGE